MSLAKALRGRKIINFISRYYFRFTPKTVLNSKSFHQFLYRVLIGSWFQIDFKNKYQSFHKKDWELLYDHLFINRIRDDDITCRQREIILNQIIGNSVLEIGCGTGTLIEKVAKNQKIKKIMANDISHEAIKFLQKKFKNSSKIELIKGDFVDIELKEPVDTIICLHVLEHIPDVKKRLTLVVKTPGAGSGLQPEP